MSVRHIVIIGGGIAGLTAAYRLCQKAEREGVPLRLTVVERENAWGGKIKTVREAGFVVEGGPDAFITSKPWAVQLCEELGLGERLLPTNPAARRVFVLWRNRLRLLPQGFLAFTPDLLGLLTTNLLSWQGKLRVALGIALPPLRWDGDVSVGTFLRYHFGAEMAERVVAPLLAGVYGGDMERLSARMTLPTLWQLSQTHRNLVWASLLRYLQRRQRDEKPSRPHFLTLEGGLGELVEALVQRLRSGTWGMGHGAKVALLSGRTVVALQATERNGEGKEASCEWQMANGVTVVLDDGERLLADAVIIATPAYAAAQLLRPHDEALANELMSIPHDDAITVSFAFDRSQVRHPLDGSGFLVAPTEKRRLLACTWTSSKFPPRAPSGKVLLRAFVKGGAGRGTGDGAEGDEGWTTRDETDEEIVRAVMDELRPILGIIGEPERAWVFRWRQAMPQYIVGHGERVVRIQQRLQRWRQLALAGNYLTGIGIPDCIRSSSEAAERVWQSLVR
jgi:oxygen-dependent protoporphyrinogen oxidase